MNPLRKKYRARRDQWRASLHRPQSRIGLHLDRHLVDHAYLRALYANFHSLDGLAYRSSQPSPRFVRKLAQQGFKAIVNLRGANSSAAFAMEAEACALTGVTLINTQLNSRRLPSVEEINRLADIFAQVDTPFVIHCKSGADRAGLASALYLLIVQQASAAEAKQQLSLKYFHLAHSKTGILGYFLDCYGQFNAQQPTPFMDWVNHHYQPERLHSGFTPSGLSSWLVDKVLHRE